MNEQLEKIVNHPQRVPVLVGLAAFAGGVGIGYILGRRNKYEATVYIENPQPHVDPNQMKFEFDAEGLAEELAEVREILNNQPARTEDEIPVYETNPETGRLEFIGYENEKTKEVRPAVEEFVTQRLKDSITDLLDDTDPVPDPEEVPEITNVFARSDDNWDYREEQLKRSSSAPYVLHKDEFYADELGYTQMTLTYYEGDNVLVDEEDAPIYNHSSVVGELKWGHGCEDPNVVHIRNDKRKAEYEVLRHEGLYTIEVLGLEIENNQRARDLKHQEDRKFRLTE